MGQPDVDFADPSEAPQMVGIAADDLLSQMAGDEIDRLLAEAESETPKPRSSLAAQSESSDLSAPASPTPVAPETESAALDHLLTSLTTGTASEPEAAFAPQASGAATEVAAEPPTPSGAGALADLPTEGSSGAADTLAQAADSVLAETSFAERSALAEGSAEASPAAENETPDQLQGPSLPWYLLPLDWINAPLAACPDFLRELIGKVAIMTTVNALALLFYVLVIRRH